MFGFELRLPARNKGTGDDLENLVRGVLEHQGTLRVGVNPRAKYTTIKRKGGRRYRRKHAVPVWLALMWNEYGNRRLPARRPLRTTLYRHGSTWNYSLRARLSLIQRGLVDVLTTMSRLGKMIVKDFRSGLETARPGNAPRTIAEKGFDRPMIWTKKLWSAIQWEWIPSAGVRSAGATARRLRSAFDSLSRGRR